MKRLTVFIIYFFLGILIFIITEQTYIYYKNDKNNLRFLLSNQSFIEKVDVQILIDEKIVYDTILLIHPGYLYEKKINEKFGKHKIDIVINGQSLYNSEFRVFLNRIFLIDYQNDSKLLIETSWRKMMIQ